MMIVTRHFGLLTDCGLCSAVLRPLGECSDKVRETALLTTSKAICQQQQQQQQLTTTAATATDNKRNKIQFVSKFIAQFGKCLRTSQGWR